MNLPDNVERPFFAYGIFKPGELGFFRVREFVERLLKNAFVAGELRQRDGLPIIDKKGRGKVPGCVLFFREGNRESAYQKIIQVEPEKHYTWGISKATHENTATPVNILFGRSPSKGSVPFDDGDWDGKKDPLFTSALDVIDETLKNNKDFAWDLRPLFRLQMAYLLLWSAIERYVSLRYHLGDKVVEKVTRLSEETAFVSALESVVTEEREVFRADKPTERVRLIRSDPKEALEYYYQIRSNITHRGKGVIRDFDTVHKSLRELYAIFRLVLDKAFEDAGNCQ